MHLRAHGVEPGPAAVRRLPRPVVPHAVRQHYEGAVLVLPPVLLDHCLRFEGLVLNKSRIMGMLHMSRCREVQALEAVWLPGLATGAAVERNRSGKGGCGAQQKWRRMRERSCSTHLTGCAQRRQPAARLQPRVCDAGVRRALLQQARREEGKRDLVEGLEVHERLHQGSGRHFQGVHLGVRSVCSI